MDFFLTPARRNPSPQELLRLPGALDTIRAVSEPINRINAPQHHAVAAVLALLDLPRVGKGTEEQG